jgi:hypothetical protein
MFRLRLELHQKEIKREVRAITSKPPKTPLSDLTLLLSKIKAPKSISNVRVPRPQPAPGSLSRRPIPNGKPSIKGKTPLRRML